MDKLTLGAFSPSVLLRVARATGRLDALGLAVEEVPVASSPAQFRSLFAGEYDAVLTSPDNAVAYRYVRDNPLGATGDVRIVSAIDRGLGLALYRGPSVGPLSGATFGVDVPTSGFAFAMYALASSIGLARDDYEVVALGSTPKRLAALLAGACAATMLNAGNELPAEEAGCVALARVVDVCGPYLGTVLAAVGSPEPVTRLAGALRDTATEICAGRLDRLAATTAAGALAVSGGLGLRYLHMLKDPREGLVADGLVDADALRTVVDLRRRYRPDPGLPAGDASEIISG